MLQDASTFRPVINGSNLGLYKTALIAAPHRQLRRTAVDGAATRLRCRNSTAAPQLDCGAANRRLLRRRNSTAVPQFDCGAATQINCGDARPVYKPLNQVLS